jgi:protease PrsW
MLSDLLTPDLYFFLHLVQIGLILLLLRYLDLYEREPVSLIVLMFVWGALGAGILAPPLNGFVSDRLPPDVELVFGAALSAPVMEELVKGLALVVAFYTARWSAGRFGTSDFDGITDGIVYGAAVGLGFAFTENIFFFVNVVMQTGSVEAGLEVFLFRVNFGGGQVLLHAAFTGLFGAGIGLASASRRSAVRYLYPVLGFLAAALLHASWNGLPYLILVAQYGFDTVAQALGPGVGPALTEELFVAGERAFLISRVVFYVWVAAIAIAFTAWLRFERQIIRFELAEEVTTGLLSPEEYALLPNFRRRLRWYAQLLGQGKGAHGREVRVVHDELVRLAMLKWRVRRRGGDPAAVEEMRRRIAARRRFVVELAQPETSAPR